MIVHKTVTPGGKGGRGGLITNISFCCGRYNVLIIYSITRCYLFLACFSVGFLYTPVQNLILLFLPITPKTL